MNIYGVFSTQVLQINSRRSWIEAIETVKTKLDKEKKESLEDDVPELREVASASSKRHRGGRAKIVSCYKWAGCCIKTVNCGATVLPDKRNSHISPFILFSTIETSPGAPRCGYTLCPRRVTEKPLSRTKP
jgi:hypothetical protein